MYGARTLTTADLQEYIGATALVTERSPHCLLWTFAVSSVFNHNVLMTSMSTKAISQPQLFHINPVRNK